MGSKTQKIYLHCQIRSFTVGINMPNSLKHILLISLLPFTEYFHTVLRKRPDRVSAGEPSSGLAHAD